MINITYNGVALPKNIKVTGVDYSPLPSISFNTIQMGKGAVASKTRTGSKLIKLSLIIEPTRGTEFLYEDIRDFASWLTSNNFGISKLTIEDDNTFYMAKVNKEPTVKDNYFMAEAEVDFLVPSGSRKGKTIKKGGYGNIPIEYEGTDPTSPILNLAFTKDTTEPIVLKNSATSETLILNGSFTKDNRISIDCSNNLVIIDNKVNLKVVALTSDNITLIKGDNSIDCNDNTIYIEVDYENNWII